METCSVGSFLQSNPCFKLYLPVVHWWQRHRATIHGLSWWRRQRGLVVVWAAQRPTLVGHHGPASTVVFASSPGGVSCSHLGGQDAGRGAGVGVGVAGMVHAVGVVMLIHTVTPERNNIVSDRNKNRF